MLLAGLLLASGCGGASRGEWNVVFPAFRDGDWGIYVVSRDGGTPVRIGASPELAFGESLLASPDGRRLLLPGGLPGNAYRLVVMNADGSGRKDLGDGDPGTASWSPDGKRIVFLTDGQPGLFVIGADGKGRRHLPGGGESGSAAWSPDGKRLAFAGGGGGAVVVVDPSGGRRRVLRRFAGDVEQLHWSRDGRSLTLLEHAPVFTHGDLVTLSVADGRLLRRVRRVDADTDYSRIAWSPDGRRVAFTGAKGLAVMNADGSARRVLGYGWEPSWAPDGRRVVYIAGAPLGATELRSIRPDGTGMRRLTSNYPDGVEPAAPAWLRGRITPAPSPYRLVVTRGRDGAALRMPFPVAAVAASGSQVALVSPLRGGSAMHPTIPPLVVWDVRSARTQRLALPGCDQPESVTVLAGRVAFDCPFGHALEFTREIRVLPLGPGRGVSLASGGTYADQPGTLPGRVAGRGSLLVFSTYLFEGAAPPRRARLWRLEGRRKALVVRGADAGEPAAVDRGRIVVEQADGQVALLRPDGRVLGRVAPRGGASSLLSAGLLGHPSAGLLGRSLVVLRRGRLLVYEASSFRLRRAFSVGRHARFAGVAGGLVAWTVGTDIHLLRVRDGREATIRSKSRSRVEAALTSAGLFYAVHPRRVPEAQVWPFLPDPATVVFLRRAALPLRP